MFTPERENRMLSEGRPCIFALASVIAAFGALAPIEELLAAFPLGASFRVAPLCSLGLLVVTWMMIWRRQMLRSRRPVAGILVIAIASAAGGYAAWYVTDDSWLHLGEIIGPWFAMSVWIAGTAFAWRRPPLEIESDAAGARLVIRCPKCGYDLRGVRELRCAECGAPFQLAALVERVLLDLAARQQ